MKGSPTAHPHYINDGRGRDTYISFSNGGFSSYPYSNSYKKDYYEISHNRYHPDLFKRRPIIKYDMDGSGRDYFIYQNILSEHDKIQGVTDFPNMLRSKCESPYRLYKSTNISKFERNLINRVYYSRSPKNKVSNAQENIKEDEKVKEDEKEKANEKDEKNSPEQKEEDIPQIYNKVENNRYETDPSLTKNNSYSKNTKSFKKNRRKINDINTLDNGDNLVNSIKAIFMFNNKRKSAEKEKEKEGNAYWI